MPPQERRTDRDIRRSQAALAWRKRARPNQVFAIEIGIAFGILLSCIGVLVAGSFALGAAVVKLLPEQPRWFVATILVLTAILVAGLAWFVRERHKSPFYPLLEIAFGAALSALGAQQSSGLSLAGVIAFIGGVRIIIDGYKRFFEYKSYLLFRYSTWSTRVKYSWRRFKRYCRDSAIDSDIYIGIKGTSLPNVTVKDGKTSRPGGYET